MALVPAIARLQTGRGTLPLRGALCLLLVVFFLYNPFCTICMSSGLSAVVHHPVSYRSTIASSELGCGTVQHTNPHFFPPPFLGPGEKFPPQDQNDFPRSPLPDPAPAVTQAFATSLW